MSWKITYCIELTAHPKYGISVELNIVDILAQRSDVFCRYAAPLESSSSAGNSSSITISMVYATI